MINIDAHLDVGWKITKYGSVDLSLPTNRAVDLPAMQKGKLNGGVFALYLSDKMQDILEASGSVMELYHQYRSISTFKEKHELNHVYLGVEGGRLINSSLQILEYFSTWGIKYLTLVHNTNLDWIDSATDEKNIGGITAFGRDVVRACQRLGILVDISHASWLSSHEVMDVVEYNTRPVIASHSGCKTLHSHARNITDGIMRRVGGMGGVVGIPFVKSFLGDYSVADHIDYAVQTIGIDHVGIGSDLDGAVCVVETVRDWEHWKEPLSNKGYSDEDIGKVAGGNWLRVFNYGSK
jgi:membrane dipeptidase